MLQAPCYGQLVYSHSHYKKFWLRQTETEDETAALGCQHVVNCPQKFSTLSAPIANMAGTPSPGQPGQAAPCCNVSLAACANSFNAPRAATDGTEATGNVAKVVPEYDLNHFEETGAVDCTLSLGTKRDLREPTPTGLSRSTSPNPYVFKSNNPSWAPTIMDSPNFFSSRNCATDCIRDIFPQSAAMPARPSRMGALAANLQDDNFYTVRHGAENSTCISVDKNGAEVPPRPSKATYPVAENDKSEAVTFGTDNCAQDVRMSVCRTPWITPLMIPEGGAPDNSKYCDTPSPFPTAGVASPLSGQSSVNGEEPRFAQRTSIQELAGCEPSNSRTVARTCAHCGTLKTPLWRNGPQGPKSLCNACGIRFKKAGRRNVSGNSPDAQGSLTSAPSPQSVKLSLPKSSKRKNNGGVTAAVARQCWPVNEAGAIDATFDEPSSHQPKRNRSSSGGAGDTMESYGSEGDETGGSSGNSCVSWQPRGATNLLLAQKLPSSSHPADHTSSSLATFLTINDAFYAEEEDSKRSVAVRSKVFGKDEEEGAKLLMALSCGVVRA